MSAKTTTLAPLSKNTIKVSGILYKHLKDDRLSASLSQEATDLHWEIKKVLQRWSWGSDFRTKDVTSFVSKIDTFNNRYLNPKANQWRRHSMVSMGTDALEESFNPFSSGLLHVTFMYWNEKVENGSILPNKSRGELILEALGGLRSVVDLILQGHEADVARIQEEDRKTEEERQRRLSVTVGKISALPSWFALSLTNLAKEQDISRTHGLKLATDVRQFLTVWEALSNRTPSEKALAAEKFSPDTLMPLLSTFADIYEPQHLDRRPLIYIASLALNEHFAEGSETKYMRALDYYTQHPERSDRSISVEDLVEGALQQRAPSASSAAETLAGAGHEAENERWRTHDEAVLAWTRWNDVRDNPDRSDRET